jgi:hypothetical protein
MGRAAAVRSTPPGKELASTLSFLLQLSFRRVWQPYALAQLSAQEQDIAAHMAQLGLVHTFNQVRALTRLGAGVPTFRPAQAQHMQACSEVLAVHCAALVRGFASTSMLQRGWCTSKGGRAVLRLDGMHTLGSFVSCL